MLNQILNFPSLFSILLIVRLLSETKLVKKGIVCQDELSMVKSRLCRTKRAINEDRKHLVVGTMTFKWLNSCLLFLLLRATYNTNKWHWCW